jgi:hypothetical protein
MKQKLIYSIVLVVAVYLPAASKECGKICRPAVMATALQEKQKPGIGTEEITALPASPFSRLLFNL